MFDSGAQRTFITSSLNARLGGKTVKYETLSFASFGGKTQSRTREIVHFDVVLENENPVAVSAIVVDKITAPLIVAGLYDIQQLPYLKGLKFAHPASPSETKLRS